MSSTHPCSATLLQSFSGDAQSAEPSPSGLQPQTRLSTGISAITILLKVTQPRLGAAGGSSIDDMHTLHQA